MTQGEEVWLHVCIVCVCVQGSASGFNLHLFLLLTVHFASSPWRYFIIKWVLLFSCFCWKKTAGIVRKPARRKFWWSGVLGPFAVFLQEVGNQLHFPLSYMFPWQGPVSTRAGFAPATTTFKLGGHFTANRDHYPWAWGLPRQQRGHALASVNRSHDQNS